MNKQKSVEILERAGKALNANHLGKTPSCTLRETPRMFFVF